MATLIKSIDDIKKYVSVNKNLTYTSIVPYIEQAERKYIKSILGTTLYDDYATTVPTGIELKAYELLREASANLSWFLYLPLAQLQISDSGVSSGTGEHFKPAEWWQIRDLRRAFIDAGFAAIDEALKIMESDKAAFSPWETSEGYTIFNELFVKRTETFQRWFNISSSRRTFLSLRHYMLESYHQYFTAQLDSDTLATINEPTTPKQKEVLDLMQAAQVNYTVAKVVESGAFDITATGIYQKLEEFPGYKTKTLEPSQLEALKRDRLIAAEQYYKKALAIIVTNPTDFTNYTAPATRTFLTPKNTKSIVSF